MNNLHLRIIYGAFAWVMSLFCPLYVFSQCNGSGVQFTPSLSLPSCGSTSTTVDVANTGYLVLGSWENGGNYTVETTSGPANQVTLHQSTFNGTVITNGALPLSISNNPFAGTVVAVLTQSGCNGTWTATSSSLRYRRNSPTSPTISYSGNSCGTHTLTRTGGAFNSVQWEGSNDNISYSSSLGTGTTITINSTGYRYYRARAFYGSCEASTVFDMNSVFSGSNFPPVYNGNVVISSTLTMQGTYQINGNFTLNSGVTINVPSGCILEIIATGDVVINGTIDANSRGATGGGGGGGGQNGNAGPSQAACGGGGGGAGNGTGGGNAGGNGSCGGTVGIDCGFACIGGNDGFFAGGGGGGGGGGGTYGGQGGNGGYGANGQSWSGGPFGGAGGAAGSVNAVYGVGNDASDIALGSGGAGGGGGGGGWNTGTAGGGGGNGGGGIMIKATGGLTTGSTSIIRANGSNGGNGGGGGPNRNGVINCNSCNVSCCGATECRDNSLCGACTYYTLGSDGGAGGGGGGGSGGGILLMSFGPSNIGGTVSAVGGNGGVANYPGTAEGPCNNLARSGGGGGGGRVKIIVNPCHTNTVTATVSVNGGSGGAANNGHVAGLGGIAGSYFNNIQHPLYNNLVAGNVTSVNQTLCQGTNPGAINANVSTGGVNSYSYQWYATKTACSSPTTGTGSSPNAGWLAISVSSNTQNLSVAGVQQGIADLGGGAGTYCFQRRTQSGNCYVWTTSISVTVDQFTTAAAGADQDVCATTATLAGNTPATGVGTWTLISGAGTITSANSPTSGLTALGAGANTFRWTLPNGSCADSQDDVVITRSVATTAAAGADQDVCATTATLAGNTPATGVGTWTLISGSGTITSPTSPTSGLTALGAGANTFRWTLPNGSCADSQDDVVITRSVATTAAAGADQDVCATTATLAGNTPATGVGTWTLISGSGTITSPTSPTSGLTALGAGANTFRWTLPNGSCADSQDDVVITRSVATTAAAGADQDVCATTATLAGNTPATGVGTWTLISGAGTITSANSPTSGLTALGSGANTFRWTLPNGSCADSQDDVIITRSDFTTAAAGPDQTICATTATLAGNTPATGVGTWTLISGSGTITSPTSPTSGLTALGAGANTFRWTLPNGSCADSQDDVIITRDQAITTLTATASPNPVCDNSTLTLTASNTGGTNITWSWSGPAGFSAATQNTTRSSLNEATHEGVYTVKAINACHPGPGGLTANTAAVNIHKDFGFVSSVSVNPNPVCEGSSITLTANFANGTPTDATYSWTGPNSFSSSAASPTRSNMQVADGGSYDVTVSNACYPGGQSNGTIASLQPVINATIAVDECMGTSPTDRYYLLVTGSGGTGTLSYSGTPVISVGNQKVYYEPAGSTVNVTITDQAAPTNCSKTVSVTAPSGHPVNIPLTANVTSSVSVNCYDVDLDRWVTFRDNSNNAILSINDNINGGAVNNNLGLVNVTVYKDAVEPTTYTTGPNCQTFTDFKAMKRHFMISSTNPVTSGEPVGVRLYFTQAEADELKAATLGNNSNAPGLPCTQNDDFSDNTGLTDLFVTKYSGPNEDNLYTNNLSSGTYRVFGTDFGIPGSPDGPLTKAPNQFSSVFSGGPGYHYVQLQVTEFSEFWLHGSYHGAPLPVEMIYFQAEAVNNSYIQLTWATAIEIDNDGFIVERSVDAQTWSNIGWVEGHDNATTQHDYSFNDYNVEPNVRYYYRLKQLDNDGDYEYTTIVSEMISTQSTFAVKDFIPNPTMNNTSLIVSSSEEQVIEVKFYDIIGQVVSSSEHSLHKGGNQITFSLEHLSAGTYTAIVTSNNEVYSKKLVVTR